MPTPACRATASSGTSGPASASRSSAADSSLSRLRWASARSFGGDFVMSKRRDPPVLCYLVRQPELASASSVEEPIMMPKVWFITGSSKGFGRIWAEAALARGDQVAATARDPRTLAELVDRYGDDVLALRLDVTDKAAVDATVHKAHERFGRLDVVVNNAGYGLFGTIEEVSE